MVQNYISMLNSKPDEAVDATSTTFMNEPLTQVATSEATAALFGELGIRSVFCSEEAELIWSFAGGSHDYTSMQWNEYLTSPFLDDDSPYEGVLDTPAQSSDILEFLNSPAIADTATTNEQGLTGMALFGTPFITDVNKLSLSNGTSAPSSLSPAQLPPTPATPANHDFDALIQMSPATPALDSSMQTSPLVIDNDVSKAAESTAAAIRRMKKAPTGTRRNLRSTDLVPVDAPTQPRNYIAPSSTSRKEVPAVFARKRARSTFDEDEDDELAGTDDASTSGLAPNEAEAIAAKRRQNTLAARRSRKRKLEYQQELENRLDTVTRERDMWKDRAVSLKSQVMQLGFPEPFRED